MRACETLALLEGEPIGFVDVGARDFLHPLIDPIAQAVAVLGFEPDRAECERMQADAALRARYADVQLEPIALADRDGPAVLHEIVAPTNSSLRPTNPVFVNRYEMSKWREVGQTELQTTTLDAILFGARAGEPHWGEAIKVDTQGTEHEILVGARRTLQERTVFACVEVSFCELYVGQKLFAEVELLMRDCGLSFYGFDNTFTRSRRTLDKRRQWGRERMFQADALFFRDPGDPQQIGREATHRQRAVAGVFAALSGYHDFALELLEPLGEAAGPVRDLVMEGARLTPEATAAEALRLAESVRERPSDANVLVGKFVDQRRALNDYFDVPL